MKRIYSRDYQKVNNKKANELSVCNVEWIGAIVPMN